MPPSGWISPNSAVLRRGGRTGPARPARKRRAADAGDAEADLDDGDDAADGGENAPVMLPTGKDVLSFIQENPKIPATLSSARYEAYKTANTAEELYEHGGTTADLDWDIDHDFLITPP